MPESSIVGPNPLPAACMTAEERLMEVATILAAGLVRVRHRASPGLAETESVVAEKHLSSIDHSDRQCDHRVHTWRVC